MAHFKTNRKVFKDIYGGIGLSWNCLSPFVSYKLYIGIHSAGYVISSSNSSSKHATNINLPQLKPCPLTLSNGCLQKLLYCSPEP